VKLIFSNLSAAAAFFGYFFALLQKSDKKENFSQMKKKNLSQIIQIVADCNFQQFNRLLEPDYDGETWRGGEGEKIEDTMNYMLTCLVGVLTEFGPEDRAEIWKICIR
jgi:hypothetical protein